jgi:outer membrane protein
MLAIILLFSNAFTSDSTKTFEPERPWALGMIARTATIPFQTEGDRTVGTLIPLIFYEGKIFYMRALEGGFRLYQKGDWHFALLGRLLFVDIPKDYQNEVQGDNLTVGLQAKYKPTEMNYLDLELMNDYWGAWFANARLGMDFYAGAFQFDPFLEFRLKSKKYNSRYFGLTQVDVNAGVDISLGLIAQLHAISNLYFYGAAKLTYLDANARAVDFVNRDFNGELYLGLGFSNDRSKPRKTAIRTRPYVRVAHGWATPTDLAKIIRFQANKDTFNNQMTSVFYGHPLTDQLFGLSMDIYLTPGFVWHHKSEVQPNSWEVVLAIKVYFTVRWPIRWRFGAAEGLSYVNKIPYVEASEMERKGYKPSNLLNFLDFSLDFNIGDIVGGDDWKRLWLGYSIHHRSAIFESAQQFGRISGGSNFQSIYLQMDF